MATIKSVLVLEDNMSNTLSKIEKQAIANTQAFNKLEKEQLAITDQMLKMQDAGLTNTKMFEQLKQANLSLGQKMNEYADGTRKAKIDNDNFNKSLTQTDIILANVKTKLIDYAVKGVSKLISLSDQYNSTSARLSNLTNSEEETLALQDKIFASANRSRGSYQALSETIAKLGMQTEGVFGNTDEIVAFSELLNKTFTASGMDTSSINSVMYNLTQSLASGKLLGNDYRILKQNAPQMIKYLQQYFNTNAAGLDEMVSKGRVSAQAIKAAMFNATDDINNKFEKMPVTFEQLWSRLTNIIQKSLEPVMKIVSEGLTFIYDNLETIIPVVVEAGLVLGALAVAWGAVSAAAWLSVPAHLAALAPILLLVTGIVAFILIMNAAAKKLTDWSGTTVSVIGLICSTIAVGFTFLQNIGIDLYNIMMGITNGIALLFIGMAEIVIGIINTIAKAIDFVFGSNLSEATQSMMDKLDTAGKNILEDGGYLERQSYQEAANKGYTFGAKIDDKLQEIAGGGALSTEDLSNTLNGIVGTDSTGGKALKTTSKDKLLSDEDIQLLLDVATRDYQLNYQQMTPNISVSFGDIRETADVDQVLDVVGTRIEELIYGDAEVVY